jgi:uncharacterized membrane protein
MLPPLQVRRVIAVALAVAYPLAAHSASILESRALTLLSVAVLAAAVLFGPLLDGRRWAWLALPVVAAVIAGLWKLNAAALVLLLPPVLLNAYLAWLFGHTLERGSEPLIVRLVRLLQPPGVPPEPGVLEYARFLTGMWTVLFVALASVNLLLAAFSHPGGLLEIAGMPSAVGVSRETWSLFANVINYLIVAAVFLLEFAYRRRRFPGRPYRNLLDFFRRTAAVAPALAATFGRKPGPGPDWGAVTTESEFTVPADHPAFAGHFPDRPVLPAVVLLEAVIGEVHAVSGMEFAVSALPRAKFMTPLAPGDRVRIRLKRSAGQVEFEVKRGDERVALGVFLVRADTGSR